MIALIALQFLISALFMPIAIDVKWHASLKGVRLEARIFDLRVATLKASMKDKFEITLNGKPLALKGKMSPEYLKLPMRMKREGVRANVRLVLRIRSDDAARSALSAAVIYGMAARFASVCRVVADVGRSSFDVDGDMKIKLNLVQIAGAIA